MEYEWTVHDIELLLNGTSELMDTFQSKYDLLIARPELLSYLLTKSLKIRATPPSKLVIAKLRWLINKSIEVNGGGANSSSRHHHQQQPDVLEKFVRWFPTLTITEIRQNLDIICFLIETIDNRKKLLSSSAKSPDIKRNDKLDVTEWFSTNRRYHLTPYKTGGKIEKVVFNRFAPRWGLVFDGSKNIMYQHTGNVAVLSDRRFKTYLTLTFKCNSTSIVDRHQYIISDFFADNTNSGRFRGVSVKCSTSSSSTSSSIKKKTKRRRETKEETAVVELYVHGVNNSTTTTTITTTSNNKNNNYKMITDALTVEEFYTLQIVWGNQNDGFYTLFKDKKCIVEKTLFECDTVPREVTPYLSVGGQQKKGHGDADDDEKKKNNSNYFFGVISNIEVLKTLNDIPPELSNLVIDEQMIENLFLPP